MALVGVYGVLAFSVTQRRQEIGHPHGPGRLAARRALARTQRGRGTGSRGHSGGVAAALALTRYLAALLYGVTATDPVTYAAVVIGLALAAAAASFLPARRAAALDPVVALRHD